MKLLATLVLMLTTGILPAAEPLRVFIFAGQSNMEGADSKVEQIDDFPPFAGLGEPQEDVRFHYCLGRDTKTESEGWTTLQAVRNMVGPELSFARKVKRHIDAPIAIIKVAAGGTTLGKDWNPDKPDGFKLYPLALERVRSALADLDRQKVAWRLEGFMWHQGENDMFNEAFRDAYGDNLENYLACWRRDLKQPGLRFYIGELCTKTIWGMDCRRIMYGIAQGQKQATKNDPLAEYIPTAHVGVVIGGGVGLHYHYGTLGQLQHGEAYADAYLRRVGKLPAMKRSLKAWPFAKGETVKFYVLAGHRNMEGERAFTAEVTDKKLLTDRHDIPFRYSLGGGVRVSDGWEPLGPTGYHQTFGPELSFAGALPEDGNHAIAKFTHSGSQIIDWTPEGSIAKDRNLFPDFIRFVKESVRSLEAKGHEVELAGIVYHLGENDMSWGPFRKGAAERLKALVEGSRKALHRPDLPWFVSQQAPTDDKRVNEIDAMSMVKEVADADPNLVHISGLDLPEQAKKLVIDTPGIIALGERLGREIRKP